MRQEVAKTVQAAPRVELSERTPLPSLVNPRLTPTLSEIQRRACKIHYERGEVFSGYTLDDWLKAEHELERKLMPSGKKDQVH